MIAFVVVELLAGATLSPIVMVQAQAAVEAVAPKTRRVCRDIQGAYTRTPRRVCTTEVVKQPVTVEAPAPPPPPVATTFEVGMAVVDSQGGAVGTITAVSADTLTVKTARHQAELPKSSLTISEGKALFGMTQAELEASIERTLAAKAEAALKVGATVKGKDGASVGTIDALDAGNVTIRLASGPRISIPRSGIAVDAEGNGAIGLTAAELEAQIRAAQPAR
jgi:hypothetical protein